MSAIHGLLRFDRERVGESEIVRQSKALAHRGSDRQGRWQAGAVGVGHLLQRVTGEDALDAQPLFALNKSVVLVADLRLDNRDALAAALSIVPDTLARLPDSELLMKAYLRWDDSCVEHLIGDFAFAIWDARIQTLTLARDHMGQRHLHFYSDEKFFIFASEIKGLWAGLDVPQTLDLSVMARTMGWDRRPSRGTTVFEGVFGLEGGTVMRVTAAGKISTRRYWEPKADPEHLNRDEAYYIKAYRDVLAEAVACRVRRASHNPALFLGGGFDSGAIAGLAGPALANRNRKLVCVASVEPEGKPLRGVRKWAQILARHMPHLDVRFVTREGLDALKDVEANFLRVGEPHSPNRYASEALMATAKQAGARVVMDGHGGDYTLNPRRAGWLARRLLRGDFRWFVSEFGAYRRHSGASFAGAIRSEVLSQILPPFILSSWRRMRDGIAMSGPATPVTPAFLAKAAPAGGEIDSRAAVRRREPAPLMAEVLRRQQSGHVIGGALLAAAHGLEFSQPYHDKRVVELALAIPETLHVRNGKDRYLARTALHDIYPVEFQDRGSANDDLIPDFPEMVERIKPALLAEVSRMETNETLSQLFDFPRMRSMLEGKKGGKISRRDERAVRSATRALLFARFIEWFQRSNR